MKRPSPNATDFSRSPRPRCPARPADTSPEAARIEREALERLGPQGRAKLTFELIEQMRMIVEAGVRARHPDYTPEQIRLARNRIYWGDDLFRQVYPGVEIET